MGRLYLQRDETGFLSENRQLQSRIRATQREMVDPARTRVRYATYQKALARFFYSISPFLMRMIRLSSSPRPIDVFFWLVCHGNEEVARAIWPRCTKPVHTALLGAAICRKMGAVVDQPAATQANERADRMQERRARRAHHALSARARAAHLLLLRVPHLS